MAQTVYGVGTSGTDRVWSVNPATGAATSTGCALGVASNANGVSPLDGLVYYVEDQGTANPDLRKINPQTCADSLVATTALPANIIRMTFCPDGRLYAASNTGSGGGNLYIYEISAATGATVRRITLTGVPTGGSGDMACVNSGDLYILANSGGGYRLYRTTSALLQGVANLGAIATTAAANLMGGGVTPNGLTEVSTVVTGCNATIGTYPCLIASTGGTAQTYGINTQTGVGTAIGATGTTLTDLSRSFPVNAVMTKTRTSSATMVQQSGLTITYVLTVTNSGPGLIGGGATVTDTLDPSVFNVAGATWTCAVTNAGSSSAVTTACGAASGTGNINQTVVLAPGAVLTYNLSAPVLASFSGVATNSSALTLVSNVTDPTPSDNAATSTTSITPGTVLTITKSDATASVPAGSTTTYTLTVANSGLAAANDAALRDAAVTGLNCTSVSCTGAAGGATCPAAGNVTIANLQNMAAGGGILLTSLPSGGTLTFAVTCGVTATGQ